MAFKNWMDTLVSEYNSLEFIEKDPVSIPHCYSSNYDIEIAGFLAATLSWGNRTTIIRKCRELMERMDNSPYQFIIGHKPSDLKQLEGFVHRTFNDTDLLYFVHRLKRFYREEGSIENAFTRKRTDFSVSLAGYLSDFRDQFFDDPMAPSRTYKHVASPERGSACKRINMFLRWMVRKDDTGVDLGIWTKIEPSELYCPLDVHVGNVARQLGLLSRKQDDWRSCEELTINLRKLDANDPVKYDYALFSAGINKLLM